MVVTRLRPEDSPVDAVRVLETDAFAAMYNFLWDWKPWKDVWPLTHGPGILGAIGGTSGLLINNHFRRWLRLGRYGRYASYAPMTIIPALAGTACHVLWVTRDIMMKPPSCPVCYELRSVAFQVGFGFAFPMILGPLGALKMAHGYRTYPVPRLLTDFPEVWRLFKKFVNVEYWKFAFIFVVNFLVATIIPYMEMKKHAEWAVAVDRLEKDFDEKLAAGEINLALEPKITRESTQYPPEGAIKPEVNIKWFSRE